MFGIDITKVKLPEMDFSKYTKLGVSQLQPQFSPQHEYARNNQKWIDSWKQKQQSGQIKGDETPDIVNNAIESRYTDDVIFNQDLIENKPKIVQKDWNAVAKQYGFNNIDEVKQWQKNNGLIADGKFGQKSIDMQNWHKTMNNKGYAISRTGDGTYSYIDNQGNRYYNNGRMMNKFGQMSNYNFQTLNSTQNAWNNTNLNDLFNVSTLDDAPLDIQQTYKTSNSYNNQYQFTPEQKKILQDLINNYYDLKETKFGSKYYQKKQFKQGGLINKHQQGGTMANNEQELQKAFMAFLIEDAATQGVKIQSEEDLKAYAQQLGKEGLQAKYQEFMQRMQGGVKAKLGAKLDYIRKIKGLCAEDEELVYMKKGGRMCPACEKKKKAMKAEEGEKLDAVKKFKCGRKVKKAAGGEKVPVGSKKPIKVINTPKGTYKKYDRGEFGYDYVTPTDSVSENVNGLDKKAIMRLDKAEKEFNAAEKRYGKK